MMGYKMSDAQLDQWPHEACDQWSNPRWHDLPSVQDLGRSLPRCYGNANIFETKSGSTVSINLSFPHCGDDNKTETGQ